MGFKMSAEEFIQIYSEQRYRNQQTIRLEIVCRKRFGLPVSMVTVVENQDVCWVDRSNRTENEKKGLMIGCSSGGKGIARYVVWAYPSEK